MVLSKDLKIAICFGLIMGAILSLCNLCFAVEDVSINVVNGIAMNQNHDSFFANSEGSIGYVPIEPGYKYTISRPNQSIVLAFSNDIPAVDVSYYGYSSVSNSFDFTYSQYNYIYIDFRNVSGISITREHLEGMNNFIDNIAYSLSVGNLSSVWVLVVPILAISVLLGLGFYLLKRLLNRIKRAKGGA